MSDEQLQAIAANLRKPAGEMGKQVGEKMNEGNKYINESSIEALHPDAGDRILEVGMGNGYFVKDIVSKANDITYTGCDFSPMMIKESERINASLIRERKASFILTEANHLPFENNSFDKILTVNTMYFWDDPSTTLAEFSRVLKPKGLLVVGIRPKSTMQYLPFVKYGFTMYTREDAVQLLSENGFTVTGYIERIEPPQKMNGQDVNMQTLIIKATRN